VKKLDAVVPVYNEQAILPELNRRLADALGGLPYEWRIIYVDDGSRDRTGERTTPASESFTCRGISDSRLPFRPAWRRQTPTPWCFSTGIYRIRPRSSRGWWRSGKRDTTSFTP
jgi:hypothetical protein